MIEAGFPITSPGDFEAVRGDRARGPGTRDLRPRPHAVPPTSTPPGTRSRTPSGPRIHTFIATSDIHIERKLQTTREDVKGQARAAVAQAREYTDDVEFSPEDGSRSDVEFMAEVIQIALDEGATTINVPDTVGYTMPDEYRAMFEQLYALVPALNDVTVSVHCHNDLGLAVANSFAGLAGGLPPGGVRRERDRRAGRQRVARGDRDAAAHARVQRRICGRARTPRRSPAPAGWSRA